MRSANAGDHSTVNVEPTSELLAGATDLYGVQHVVQKRSRLAICLATCTALISACLLIAATDGETSGPAIRLESGKSTMRSTGRLPSSVGTANTKVKVTGGMASLGTRQDQVLKEMYSNDFLETQRSMHQAEDAERQHLLRQDKEEEKAGLAHLQRDDETNMVRAAKAASDQLSQYASIYGTATEGSVEQPAKHADTHDEQETAAAEASDQLAQYNAIYGRFMDGDDDAAGATHAPLHFPVGTKHSAGMSELIAQTKATLAQDAGEIAMYVQHQGRHAVAGQELKDILDGSLFQVKSVQDELAHKAAAAVTVRSDQATSSSSAPSMASMLRKYKAWEAARHTHAQQRQQQPLTDASSQAPAPQQGLPSSEAAARPVQAQPSPAQATRSSSSPLVGPWPTANAAASQPASSTAALQGRAAAAAAGPGPVTGTAALSACDAVAREFKGRPAEMEVACGQEGGRCRFDFATQHCGGL